MPILFFVAILAFTLPAAPSPQPGECSAVTDTAADGTLAARVTCAWDLPPDDVARVIGAYDRHDRVFGMVSEAEALGRDAQGRALYRQVHAAPFISEREVVLAVHTETLSGGSLGEGVRYTWGKASPHPEVSEGRVEPSMNEGVWEIRSDGRGGTRLDYEIRLQPGGDIPSAVISWLQGVAVDAFFDDLESAVRASVG